MAEDGADYTVRRRFPARTSNCARFHAAGEVSRHRCAATPGYHRPRAARHAPRATGTYGIAASTFARRGMIAARGILKKPWRRQSMKRALVGILATALLAAVSVASAQTTRLSIGTGGTGGVYYPLGGGMASILSKHVPGWQATAEVTGASVANLQLIGQGKQDFGFTMADAAWDAVSGLAKFKDRKVEARTLMVLYPNKVHVVTVAGNGVEKLSGLQGQAHLHRRAQQRHRTAGTAPARGGRHRQGRHPRAAFGCGRRQRDQGPQDRRPDLGRRPADGGDHRPGDHAGHHGQADRSRGVRATT